MPDLSYEEYLKRRNPAFWGQPEETPYQHLANIRQDVSRGLSGIASPEAVATSPEFARAMAIGDFTAPSRNIPASAPVEPWQMATPASEPIVRQPLPETPEEATKQGIKMQYADLRTGLLSDTSPVDSSGIGGTIIDKTTGRGVIIPRMPEEQQTGGLAEMMAQLEKQHLGGTSEDFLTNRRQYYYNGIVKLADDSGIPLNPQQKMQAQLKSMDMAEKDLTNERGIIAQKAQMFAADIKEGAGKTKSVDQRIVGMLRDKLKREPTDEEVLKAIQARDIEKQRLGVSDPLTESALGIEAMKYILTGKFPAFRRDVEKSKISNLAGKIAEEKGWTAQDQLRMQTDFKSMNTSTIAQKKNYDAMHGFVINMDKQMARLEEIYAKIPRTQYRLLNIPIVELRARAMGKGEEAAAAALLLELGNESGKLSTNSASSIRELSQTAQEQWAKIHDNKLSFEDLKIVLDTTKKLGHDRLTSTQEAMDFTKDQITALGGGKQPVSPTATGTKKMKPITLKGGKVIYVEE